MRKHIIRALLFSVLLPFTVDANQEGLWVTTTKPGYFFVVIEGDVNSRETAGMIVLTPAREEWEIYFGPDSFNFSTFQNTVQLAPLSAPSDMQATWTANDTKGSLFIKSCTRNCLWNPGQRIPFTKFYGEGVNLGGGGSSGGDGGGSSSAGTWAGRGTNPDGSTFEACFNVSADGKKITPNGSQCDDGNSLDIEIDDARETDGDDCDVNIGYPNQINIVNNSFSINNWRPSPFAPVVLSVTATLSGNNVTGTLRSVTDFGDVCQGSWSASPR